MPINKIKAGSIDTGSITSDKIANDTIANADISSSAAIAYSKLNLATSIANADISSSAAIAYSKLNLATSIVNADISSSAAIATTKLGTGAVLQVVTATDSTQRSTTSASFVTGSNTLSVSITPSSASNKVFLIVHVYVYALDGMWTVFRGATNIGNATGGLSGASGNVSIMGAYTKLDSPNTTSATTYQVYFRATSGTSYLGGNNAEQSITAFEIAG
jgi:hypothetical protein